MAFGVQARSAHRQRPLVDVGGEDLHAGQCTAAARVHEQEHGHGVRLLPRGATRHPGAHLGRRRAILEQFSNHDPLERIEGGSIPKEVGHADEHVLQQQGRLLRVLLQELCVLRQRDLQASFNAAQEDGALVAGQGMAGALAQHLHDAEQRFLGRVLGPLQHACDFSLVCDR